MTEKNTTRRTMTGTVVSNKADKTVAVMVVRKYKHTLYKKMVTSRKKYLAHDENNSYKEGDKVKLQECAPISSRKKWCVIEKIETIGRQS